MVNIINLPSGVRLVTEYMPHVHSVATGIWVGNGAIDEEDKYSGISHFIEHMMFKGTKNRTAKQIASDIDAIGGQINAFTGKEATCYYVKTTSENIEKAADVLVDMLTNSSFEKKEMDRERLVICEEIKMNRDTPDDVAHENAENLVFNGRSIGNSALGTPTSLNRITSNVMRSYVKEKYTTDRIVISVAGNFDEARLIDYYSDKFTELSRVQKKTDKRDDVYTPGYKSVKKDIAQTHICLATQGVGIDDKRYYALSVLNNAMGGSMSSRLFQNIREQKGLAYSVYSMNASFTKDGYYSIYAGIGHDKLRSAVKGIREELNSLAENGITPDELESSREQLKSSYIFSLESTSGVMFKNGKNLLLLDKVYTPDDIIKSFNDVTMKDIEEAKTLICDFDRYSACVVSSSKTDVKALMRG